MRLVCMSDTHLRHNFCVPDGDVLIHAGDATLDGNVVEVSSFAHWFGKLPHERKIFVPGNHDWLFQRQPSLALSIVSDYCDVLIDQALEIDGFTFWGSPWQPEFMGWAFNLPRGEKLAERWALIPDTVDVLITHGPPYGIGDVTYSNEHVGCEELRCALIRVQPIVHVFGHIHWSYGLYNGGLTKFVNASVCAEDYKPSNGPIVIDLP